MAATRQSWPNVKPLPQQRVSLSLKREFTQKEYDVICEGLIPEAMEDKWFIFLEDDVLYVHRSWTGFCIYQLRLAKNGENYTITEAWANRDPNQYSATDDGHDEKLLIFLIDNLLLERPRQTNETTITVRSALSWFWAWIKWLIRGIVR